MRALLQRVNQGRVRVAGKTLGEIGPGLVIFLGVRDGDEQQTVDYLVERIAHLRIFEDAEGKTNLSALEVGAGMLVISQFTLYADCRRGRRPGFSHAARPEIAEPLYEAFKSKLAALGFKVAGGQFGAMMLVEIHNQGPFTIMLDSDEKRL